jgi:hypothetical protein
MKKYLYLGIFVFLIIFGMFIFFRFFFTYEQRNKFMRSVETVTGQNLTITTYDMNGKIIRRWSKVQKITSGEGVRSYVFFYTADGKYVQIPDSLWYIAEEE